MADPRFFDRAGPFTLEALAALSGARVLDPQGGARLYRDVGPLETAGPEDVSFLENRKYLETFIRSRAGAAFVDEHVAGRAPRGMALLVSNEPYRAYALAARAFYPARLIIPRRAPSAVFLGNRRRARDQGDRKRSRSRKHAENSLHCNLHRSTRALRPAASICAGPLIEL